MDKSTYIAVTGKHSLLIRGPSGLLLFLYLFLQLLVEKGDIHRPCLVLETYLSGLLYLNLITDTLLILTLIPDRILSK